MIVPDSIAADLRLLTKLGSISVHIDEYLTNGHQFDESSLNALLADPEVRDWLDEMDKLSLVPKPSGTSNQESKP